MRYTVSSNQLKKVNLAPATKAEEILQNILVIVASISGCNCLARDIGIRGDYKGRPLSAVRSFIVGQVHEQIFLHEPRAEVVSTTVSENHLTGELQITLEVEIDATWLS
ncbi:MAG: hypothetical protein FWE08_06220 [Oscillospiraceae bacterium]|nr:hypothetical protein [Oscillospiraceae bacterium]